MVDDQNQRTEADEAPGYCMLTGELCPPEGTSKWQPCAKARRFCIWNQDREGTWETACDNRFMVNEGLPSENGMQYCCYCGRRVQEVAYAEEVLADE